jgi:hypothetical protein
MNEIHHDVRVARAAVYGSGSIADDAGEARNVPPGLVLGSESRLLLWLPPSAVRRATMQGPDSPALTSVANAMAASAKSMAAVVLQLSTMPPANAARLGAGRSIASRVEAHSQAPPWLDNAVSKLFASSCCRALVPPVCSTESPSSSAVRTVAVSAGVNDRWIRLPTRRMRLGMVYMETTSVTPFPPAFPLSA